MRAQNDFRPVGHFKVEHIRDGKVIAEYEIPNGIVDAGLNHILETEFHGGTQVTTWYFGLVDNAGFLAFAAGDTVLRHVGWVECVSYDEVNRPAWTAGAATSRQITNASSVIFTISATKTIKGLFVASNNSKGGTAGTLWSTATFGSPVPFLDNDLLRVTYTING